ncbi:MAG: hypothetical protein LBT43_13165 [Prevotella sp.]|nr:hypothetical protein [Prevotella sp.]
MEYNTLCGSDYSAGTRYILPFQTQKYRCGLLRFAGSIIEVNALIQKIEFPLLNQSNRWWHHHFRCKTKPSNAIETGIMH